MVLTIINSILTIINVHYPKFSYRFFLSPLNPIKAHENSYIFQRGRSTTKQYFIELDDGKIYRKALYLMVKTMVSG